MTFTLKPNPVYDFSAWEEITPAQWQAIADTKPLAVIMRGSYQLIGSRNRYEDVKAVEYVLKAKSLGLRTGLYHFLTPNGIAEQVALFMSVWNKCGGTDLPPIVDVEIDLQASYSKSPAIIGNAVWQSHIKTFIDAVAAATGKTPIIYTSQKYWVFACTKNVLGQFVAPTWTKDYPLWVAQYPNEPETWTKPTAMPIGWTDWAMWQYSEKGRQNGFVANDLNTASAAFTEEITGLPPVVIDPPVIVDPPTGITKTHTIEVFSDGSITVDGVKY